MRYEQVESTNTLARECAEQGEPEGLIITAEEQLAGRGRFGRKWSVPRGTSLQFSIILRPPLAPQYAWRVMPMAALAIATTLEQELSIPSILKWSNDVLVTDATGVRKKVSGILTESSVQGDSLAYVILGIGLNVNYTMRDYPELAPNATTIQDFLGHLVDRANLETALFARLDHYYSRIRHGETLMDEYRTHLGTLGQQIRVANHDTILEGIAYSIDEDGALILRQEHGDVKLYAGDVTILKDKKEVV